MAVVGAGVARVGSVAKAARVLQAFTPLATSLSVRQLAERTGIPRSTVHALCVTLCDAGLLEEAAGRGYRLGPALVGLGGQVIERIGLVGAAEGVLDRLVPGDGLEIHLGQLVGGWVVYLDRASGPVRAPMHNRVGLRAPAHLTGCGKAALALLPPQEVAARVEAVCAAESRQLPDLDALARELARARRAGFVVSDTFQPGRTSVAAPIPDLAGAPAGGVSVAGPTPLLAGPRLDRIRSQVMAAATLIAQRLGRPTPGR
ncbi:MAG TPA: IclR family transcriptional regulator [Actinomycetota bacterium]|jgi:DNA-binding IclR family transcriptional regulator|nr:IclR family transcriptional regulator [Actinomycetota bacterium]